MRGKKNLKTTVMCGPQVERACGGLGCASPQGGQDDDVRNRQGNKVKVDNTPVVVMMAVTAV